MSEEEHDKWYELGRLTMLKEKAGELLKISGDLFSLSQDEKAGMYRDLAREFKIEHFRFRAEYDKKYHRGEDEEKAITGR